MEIFEAYIGEIVLGSAGSFLAAGIAAYKALMRRIKIIEETQIRQQGEINLNTALDKERAK